MLKSFFQSLTKQMPIFKFIKYMRMKTHNNNTYVLSTFLCVEFVCYYSMGKYTGTNLRFKTIYFEVNSSRHKGGHPLHLTITRHLKVRFGRKHESRPIKTRVSWRLSLVYYRSCRKCLTSAKFCEHTC